MPFIKTNNTYPGILSLLYYKAPTGKRLSALAHQLLLGKSPLSSGDREKIAAYVSALNNCHFCCDSHASACSAHLGQSITREHVLTDEFMEKQTPKLKALLAIAGKVQKGGKHVEQDDIDKAKSANASDEEIHDTVLVAAAFCMYNRYVDGLGTIPLREREDYKEMGERMAFKGYKYPPFFLRWLVRRILNKKYPDFQ